MDGNLFTPFYKPHLVTLSFDDGFKDSFTKIALIHEKYHLSACLNVIASGPVQDVQVSNYPQGDFDLWNELKSRGHEIMPHSLLHENLQTLSTQESKDRIQRCLEIFKDKLTGFDPKQSIFNFPCDAPQGKPWGASLLFIAEASV